MSLFLWISCSGHMDGEMGGMQRSVMMLPHGFIYPADIFADLGTDAWVIGLATRESSLEQQVLQGTFAHQCFPWVTVAGNGLGVRDASIQHRLSHQVLVNPLIILEGEKPEIHTQKLQWKVILEGLFWSQLQTRLETKHDTYILKPSKEWSLS